MTAKKFVGWYDLPKVIRDRLFQIAPELQDMRDHGKWYIRPDWRTNGEENAFLFRTAGSCLTYDFMMPRLKAMMNRSIKIAIFSTFKRMDILFILPRD